MGYLGLEHILESDNASDLAYEVQNAMAQALLKGLEEKGNCYNTCGVVNVAMFFRDVINPIKDDVYHYNENLLKVAKITHEKLSDLIKKNKKFDDEWGDKDNHNTHMKAYGGMLKSLEGFIENHV